MIIQKPATDPSAIVLPFGKHKGKTVAELLATDPAYADWVTAQGWVAERFAELHAAILTRGAGTDDTPEHNAIQARFLDPDFRRAVLDILRPKVATDGVAKYAKEERASLEWQLARYEWKNQHEEIRAELAGFRAEDCAVVTDVLFEANGIDVVLRWAFTRPHDETRLPDFSAYRVNIELKPTMGDDYPTVMRQMGRLYATALVLGVYTGRGASESQMRSMFDANRMQVVFLQEIEERMREP